MTLAASSCLIASRKNESHHGDIVVMFLTLRVPRSRKAIHSSAGTYPDGPFRRYRLVAMSAAEAPTPGGTSQKAVCVSSTLLAMTKDGKLTSEDGSQAMRVHTNSRAMVVTRELSRQPRAKLPSL